MKIKLIIFLSLICFCCSCASIMNSNLDEVTIITNKPATIFINDDTVGNYVYKKTMNIKRNKEDLRIKVVNDSISKIINVESSSSFAFYSNIFMNYGLGMLIDKNNPKRYTYPSRIYINTQDTLPEYFTYYPWGRKGDLYFHTSFPHINNFLLKPDNEPNLKYNTGFWGITFGLDYYHSQKQFLSFTASGASDFWVPVPAAIDMWGEYELMSSLYLSVSNNHRLWKLLVGYGISFAYNTWDLRYYDAFDAEPPTRDPVTKSNNALGLVFPVYYQFGKTFFLGAVYRPTFIRFESPNTFEYEHLISFDFGWKVKLN